MDHPKKETRAFWEKTRADRDRIEQLQQQLDTLEIRSAQPVEALPGMLLRKDAGVLQFALGCTDDPNVFKIITNAHPDCIHDLKQKEITTAELMSYSKFRDWNITRNAFHRLPWTMRRSRWHAIVVPAMDNALRRRDGR
jgi:hypothetical protein